MNAEIEHASPCGKDAGEKVPGQKKKIGAAAGRAYKERLQYQSPQRVPSRTHPQPVAAWQATPSAYDRKIGLAVGLPLIATRLWNRFRRNQQVGA
jgi:hypothetical protein